MSSRKVVNNNNNNKNNARNQYDIVAEMETLLGRRPDEITRLAIQHFNKAADYYNRQQHEKIGEESQKCIYLLKELYKYYFSILTRSASSCSPRMRQFASANLPVTKNRLVKTFDMLGKSQHREGKFIDSMKSFTHAIMWSDLSAWYSVKQSRRTRHAQCIEESKQKQANGVTVAATTTSLNAIDETNRIDSFIDMFCKSKAKARRDSQKRGQNLIQLFSLCDILRQQQQQQQQQPGSLTDDILLAIGEEELRGLKQMEMRYKLHNGSLSDRLHIVNWMIACQRESRAKIDNSNEGIIDLDSIHSDRERSVWLVIEKEILECAVPQSVSTNVIRRLLTESIKRLESELETYNKFKNGSTMSKMACALLHITIVLFEYRLMTMSIQEQEAILSLLSKTKQSDAADGSRKSKDNFLLQLASHETWKRLNSIMSDRFGIAVELLGSSIDQNGTHLETILLEEDQLFDLIVDLMETAHELTQSCGQYEREMSEYLIWFLEIAAKNNRESLIQVIASSKIVMLTCKQWIQLRSTNSFLGLDVHLTKSANEEDMEHIQRIINNIKPKNLRRLIKDPLDLEDAEDVSWRARQIHDITTSSIKIQSGDLDNAQEALELKLSELMMLSQPREGRRELVALVQHLLSMVFERKLDIIQSFEHGIASTIIRSRIMTTTTTTASAAAAVSNDGSLSSTSSFVEQIIGQKRSDNSKNNLLDKPHGIDILISLLYAGYLYESRGALREAQYYLNQGLHLALYSVSPFFAANFLLALGEIDFKRCRFDSAEQHYLKAMEMGTPSVSPTLVHLIQLYITRRDYDRARETISRAENILGGGTDNQLTTVLQIQRILLLMACKQSTNSGAHHLEKFIDQYQLETSVERNVFLKSVAAQMLLECQTHHMHCFKEKERDRIKSLLLESTRCLPCFSPSVTKSVYAASSAAHWEDHPIIASVFANSALGLTLRHTKLTVLNQKIKAWRNQNNNEAVEALEQQLKEFNFTGECRARSIEEIGRNSRVIIDKIQHCLPQDITVCSITLSSNFQSLILTRLEVDRDPVVIKIPLFRTDAQLNTRYDMEYDDSSDRGQMLLKFKSTRPISDGQNLLYCILHEFYDILDDSEKSMQHAPMVKSRRDRADWWSTRHRIEEKLKMLVHDMENLIFGPWKGFLLGTLVEQSENEFDGETKLNDESVVEELQQLDLAKLEIAAALLTTELSNALPDGAPEINRQLVEILIGALPYMCKAELVEALRMLLERSMRRSDMDLTDSNTLCDEELRVTAMKFYKMFAETINEDNIVSGSTRETISEVVGDLDGLGLSSFVTTSRGSARRRMIPEMTRNNEPSSLNFSRQDFDGALPSTPLSHSQRTRTTNVTRNRRRIGATGSQPQQNYEIMCSKLKNQPRKHVVLILDKFLHMLPWESMPVLRSCSVSRVPSWQFLLSQLQLLKQQADGRLMVDTRSTFYVLNPSGDLKKTQQAFEQWFKSEDTWEGLINEEPQPEQITNALQEHDIFIYMGHNAGEKFCKPDQIRTLDSISRVALLMGCSSGMLKDHGEYEPSGTVQSYIVAGSSCIVANLWNVTDKDCDRFSHNLIMNWMNGHERDITSRQRSLTELIPAAREACKLPYLMGAAPVCYGLPVYCVRHTRSDSHQTSQLLDQEDNL